MPLLARGVVASYCAVLTCTRITRAFRRHILQRNTTDICWWEMLSILPINSRRNLRVATNFSTTESKYIGLFPNAWISLTYRTYRGSVFLLINEEISDKLWESALADPFQFTIYSRQKASLSRYGAREDAWYYQAMSVHLLTLEGRSI